MSFAASWLDKRALFPDFIYEPPDDKTGIIVIVPAYDEPEITKLLDSLSGCDKPECGVEVIIIVNAPPQADTTSLRNNRQTIENIEAWKKMNSKCFFRLFVFDTGQPALPGWGVGLARKTGMDEAVRRFDILDKKDGVIVSLDADCRVDSNYFTAISHDLLKRKERSACSVYFEHPLSGDNFHDALYRGITLYELHLRYYLQGLRYSGFPYAFHTIGSAIAFKAGHYIRAGGMNRRQAGEDFYFIQKLVQQNGYFSLNSTTVYPSPRQSSRVPFGTGPVMGRIMDNKEGRLYTFSTESYDELRYLFASLPSLFSGSGQKINDFYDTLPAGLGSFIDKKQWADKILEIRANTSGFESFRKRFFGWFNMFRIVKYMNHVHKDIFEKKDVAYAADRLLFIKGDHFRSKDPRELLLYYRSLEKE
jgi:hypothetical protein